MYRALRNISISRHGIVLKDHPVDPSWLSEAGVERLLARGYIEVVVAEATPAATLLDAASATWIDTGVGLTTIRGIGKERAKLLAELGLGGIEALAQATPEQLTLLEARGIPAKQAANWKAQAAALLQPSGTLTSGGTCERCKTKKNAR